MKSVTNEINGVAHPFCGSGIEDAYHNIIKDYPDFPFTYFALASCKHTIGDPIWKDYAEKAIEIFKITTSIGGHNPEHDNAYLVLKNMR